MVRCCKTNFIHKILSSSLTWAMGEGIIYIYIYKWLPCGPPDSEGPASLAGLRSLLNGASHSFKAFLSQRKSRSQQSSHSAYNSRNSDPSCRSAFHFRCSLQHRQRYSWQQRTALATCRIAVSVLSFAKHGPEGLNIP